MPVNYIEGYRVTINKLVNVIMPVNTHLRVQCHKNYRHQSNSHSGKVTWSDESKHLASECEV